MRSDTQNASLRIRQLSLAHNNDRGIPLTHSKLSQVSLRKKHSKVKSGTISCLHGDLKFVIATFLTPQEILQKIQILSKVWRNFILKNLLWKNLIKVWPPELELSPYKRLRKCKTLTTRRSRGSVLIAEDRITGETYAVRAMNIA